MNVITTFARLGVLSSLSLLVVSGALSVGCTDTATPADGADSGVAPVADGGTDAAACATTGVGALTVNVVGLPDGVTAKVKLTGPSGTGTPAELTASQTIADAAAGTYEVTAARVANTNAIVRTVYEAKVSAASLCLAGAQTVTVTYSEVASSIGKPRAVRAVARACATNPVALAIPCHRVVPAAGGQGGYRWGVNRKKALLASERR